MWAHLKLVAFVKDFANQMKHIESISLLLMIDHVIDEPSQHVEAVFDNLMQWFPVFI